MRQRDNASKKILLETEYPIASDSIDHLHPLGTMQDNYTSPVFTRKLTDLYEGSSFAVLDLGCAGGGFVKEVNDTGNLAVGLEGSDYSRRHRRAEWGTIPDRLFTCDCTRPFSLSVEANGGIRPLVFQAITAWEFLEHIPEDSLDALLENIRRHLDPERGLFIASIHLRPCPVAGHEYHATVRPEWWWRTRFLERGFCLVDRALEYFDEDWVRGASIDQNALGSCHVVLSLNPANAIVRRVERVASGLFEHARIGRGESRQILEEYHRREAALRAEVGQMRVAIESASQADAPFAIPVLTRLAAHAMARCRQAGFRQVAFFGAGNHTRLLIPMWRNLGGPEVKAILASTGDEADLDGVPVIEAGRPLPEGIDAIIPSSHAFERDMKAVAKARYPFVPWVFLWNPEAGG